MPHKLTSNRLIAQSDTNICYPGTSKSAFTDLDFYKGHCGKGAGTTGTISGNGCAICVMAMFILYKGGLSNTNDNTFYAVEQACIKGTNSTADFYGAQSFTASVGGNNISVNITTTTDIAQEMLDGNLGIIRIEGNNKSHYLLADGIDESASGTSRYLVADSAGGKLRTLSEALKTAGITDSTSSITEKYKIS